MLLQELLAEADPMPGRLCEPFIKTNHQKGDGKQPTSDGFV